MLIIRPVIMEDLDQFVELAFRAHFGITSLPRHADLLRRRIVESEFSFRKSVDRPGGELYVFVMEETESRKLVGTSCIFSKVGGFQPFYAYEIQTSVHESKDLGIRRELPTLHLVAEHSGPTEIGGIFLLPEYRKHGNGRLLSLFRFLFMRQHPKRFEQEVIAEMRGVLDDEGRSPFWEALGRLFFGMDYHSADLLSAHDKKFIADLMPTTPIFIPLLPQSAQEVIGEVHHNTRPALRMLEGEGFRFTKMVDIFEGGPVISCELEKIRIVRERCSAKIEEITDEPVGAPQHIVTNAGLDFRGCMGTVVTGPDGARVGKRIAEALRVKVGDRVVFAPLKPPATTEEIPS